VVYQAKQAFYVKDTCNERWCLVIQWRIELDVNNHDDSRVQYVDNPSLSRHIAPLHEENDVDEVHATQNDHRKGIWENILTLHE